MKVLFNQTHGSGDPTHMLISDHGSEPVWSRVAVGNVCSVPLKEMQHQCHAAVTLM